MWRRHPPWCGGGGLTEHAHKPGESVGLELRVDLRGGGLQWAVKGRQHVMPAHLHPPCTFRRRRKRWRYPCLQPPCAPRLTA
jgi:hypothetical protein